MKTLCRLVAVLIVTVAGCDEDDDPAGTNAPNADLALYRADSIVVRHLLDLNGLQSIPVERVTDSANGRVVKLGLWGLGIRHLSDQIGRLDAVRWLYLHDNRLATLPDSITRLRPCSTLTIGRNRLCALPAGLREWLDLYATIPGWETTQECVGLHEDTAGVRAILDANGLFSVRTLSVCDTAADRVTGLRLAQRNLTVLPETVGVLTRLVRLDLRDNQLRVLPLALLTLDSLREVLLDDNRLCSLDIVVAAWADRISPGWRQFQDCSTAATAARATSLFCDAQGFSPDSMEERDPRWLCIATTSDSLIVDSIRLSAERGSLPLVVRFRPVGVPAYYATADTFCVLRTVGTTYALPGGSPTMRLGPRSVAYLVDFDIQPCLECSTIVAVPGLVIGVPIRAVAVFHFRRMYPDTLVAGEDTLVIVGTVDGTAIGALRPLASQLMEFGTSRAETVDFSLLTGDTCDDYLSLRQDTAYDLLFWADSLRAPGGIKLICVARAESDVLPCASVAFLRTTLDTLSYAVRQAGYGTAARFVVGGVYMLRTMESDRMLIVNVGNYLGGVPRYQFFWARYAGR